MTDLLEFLQDRLDDDEAALAHLETQALHYSGEVLAEQAALRLTDARRVSKEIEGKLRIIQRYLETYTDQRVSAHMWQTIKDLAFAYADHPDYQDKWRP